MEMHLISQSTKLFLRNREYNWKGILFFICHIISGNIPTWFIIYNQESAFISTDYNTFSAVSFPEQTLFLVKEVSYIQFDDCT